MTQKVYSFTEIGFERLLVKQEKKKTEDPNCDYLPDLPSSPKKRSNLDSDSNIPVTPKKKKKEEPHVKIKCSVSIGNGSNTDTSDDVILVKECKSSIVKFEVKIGSSSDLPIYLTGDNSGINASNPIVID